MAHEFTFERRVEFAETDMAGIVHFSNFFKYMESAEHAFFRSLGLRLHGDEEAGVRGWARVHAECDYKAPLRYDDVVEIRLRVVGKGSCTLSYTFDFYLPADAGPGVEPVLHAHGEMRVCCVGRAPGERRLQAMPMSAAVDAAVQVAPDSGSDRPAARGVAPSHP